MKLLQQVIYRPFDSLPELYKIGWVVSGPYYTIGLEIYEVLFDTDNPRIYPKCNEKETVIFLDVRKIERIENGISKYHNR